LLCAILVQVQQCFWSVVVVDVVVVAVVGVD
jgi:hypothetical protein